MINYILRRIFYAILILIGVNFFTFALFFFVNSPDDMARAQLGAKRVTQEAVDKWKRERGYDRPLFFSGAAAGLDKVTDTIFYEKSVKLFVFDFGRSDQGRNIGYDVKTRMWASLAVQVPVFIVGLVLFISLALLMAFFRATYVDFWGVVLCVVLMSISSLFYIIMAQWLFGKTLKLVPLSGFVPGLDLVKFLALPLVVGIVFQLGSEARLFRAMLLEETNKDYVRTARSKGLSEAAVLFRHVLRNAWLPVLTHLGALLPYAFLGSIVFESFFGIPGLGTYVIEAIGGQDFAIVHTMVFLGSLLYILAYLLTDVAYTFVDPRVRLT